MLLSLNSVLPLEKNYDVEVLFKFPEPLRNTVSQEKYRVWDLIEGPQVFTHTYFLKCRSFEQRLRLEYLLFVLNFLISLCDRRIELAPLV